MSKKDEGSGTIDGKMKDEDSPVEVISDHVYRHDTSS